MFSGYPCFSFCVDFIGIGIDHHFTPSTFNILVDSAKKERILNTTETKFRVFSDHKDASTCFDRFLCFDAYRFMSCAFLLSPFSESPRHRNQNRSSSFFSEEGFLPATEAPGISSSVR